MLAESHTHYLAAVLGESPFIYDVHPNGHRYGGSWVTAAAKADYMRDIPEVDDSSLLSFHSSPRQEIISAPHGLLEVDLINPGVEPGAILPDDEQYHHPPISTTAMEGIRRFLDKSDRGPGDILHAHHWTSALAIGPANEAGMTSIFTPDMPGPFNLRGGRNCSGVRFAVELEAMARSNHITVNTWREREAVLAFYTNTVEERKLLARKIAVFPPGIDTTTFNPVNAANRRSAARSVLEIPYEAQSLIVSAGRLSVAKNFEATIEGWRSYTAEHDDPSQYLVIFTNITYGDAPYLKDLQERISNLPLNARSRVLLRDFQQDPMNVYSVADIFVTTSRLETYGSSLSEAMACGIPVIASGIDEYREQLGLDGEGALRDAQNYLASQLVVPLAPFEHDTVGVGTRVAQALEFIVERTNNDAKRKRMYETMQRLGSKHSWDAITRKILDLSRE